MSEPTIYKAYKCRLYPKPAQEEYFRRMFACCRVVYNHFLRVQVDAHEARKAGTDERVPTRFDMCRMLTTFKKTELDSKGRPYLKDVDSTALVYELKHLEDAFRRFFGRVRDEAPAAGFPHYKTRGDKNSCTVAFKRADFIERNRIRFAKIGWVNAKVWREIEGTPVSCTVSVDGAGRWWAAISCRDVPAPRARCSDEVAVVKVGAGAASVPPVDEALARRIRREERRLAKCDGSVSGAKSKRYKKQMRRLARLRARSADRMRTQANQATSAIVQAAGTVVMASPSAPTPATREIERQLRYKCRWYGRELVEDGGDARASADEGARASVGKRADEDARTRVGEAPGASG